MAHHLVDGGIGLDVEKPGYGEGTHFADDGDIIAQEVDDHSVLSLRLLVGQHGGNDRLVLFRGAPRGAVPSSGGFR